MIPRDYHIAVSACLLGQMVRYDGGHSRFAWLVEELPARLGAEIVWQPVCPESELGLGVPRPPIRLLKRADQVALVRPADGLELTKIMGEYSFSRVHGWAGSGLDGAVLKARSPSCGIGNVEVHARADGDLLHREGTGLFAATLIRELPWLRVVSEADLAAEPGRSEFIEALVARRSLAADY